MSAVLKEFTVGERLLTIEGVCVSYDKPVLKKLDAKIDNIVRDGMQQGQVVALLGPSGSGKTQLFRCIAGLQRPNSGSIRLKSSTTQVMPGEVGVVAQHYPLFNHRTVLGNLLVAASRHTKDPKQAREKAVAMLEEFHLEDKAMSYPQSLSGGQRQRIAIAQQLLCSSHFLLMDEPFSGLDPLAKRRVCETIAGVSGKHDLNTMIVVTHDIESAIAIADTVWVLGRDRDDKGNPVPGARIQEVINLAEMGMAWDPDIESRPEFFELTKRIKRQFAEL
ncbi:ABC transporter ATP-binding protein [Massilia glaciei]|uniref:ABC transporter ATP-binding protein n=1 Tax=Massilia glaciei TaxID=1524097 RepID=A0A2U2HA15_9BURK|nr:ATP-binding cassette domain-containing protein [Massilia glaciei]PWF39540.1 ABC transporter ATP-binding protein [Massilia glaciei]